MNAVRNCIFGNTFRKRYKVAEDYSRDNSFRGEQISGSIKSLYLLYVQLNHNAYIVIFITSLFNLQRVEIIILYYKNYCSYREKFKDSRVIVAIKIV